MYGKQHKHSSTILTQGITFGGFCSLAHHAILYADLQKFFVPIATMEQTVKNCKQIRVLKYTKYKDCQHSSASHHTQTTIFSCVYVCGFLSILARSYVLRSKVDKIHQQVPHSPILPTATHRESEHAQPLRHMVVTTS